MDRKSGAGNVIVFAAEKGGVGKTTLTVNTAAVMASRGLRVLVVDSDPQGNATIGLGVTAPPTGGGTAELLAAKPPPVGSVAVPTRVDGVWVTAADRGPLADRGHELARRPGGERALARALAGGTGFDVVLVDTPPNLEALTLAAVCAAGRVVGVMEPSRRALEGVLVVADFVDRVRDEWQVGSAVFAGVVYNSVDRAAVTGVVRELAGEQGLGILAELPRRTVVRQAEALNEPVVVADPTGAVTIAVVDLVDRLNAGRIELDLRTVAPMGEKVSK